MSSQPSEATPSPTSTSSQSSHKILFDDFYLAKIDQFVKYFEETYLQSNIFPTKLWNHYETTGPRTNNHVEGYNDRLKGYCGAATQSCVLKCLINEH